MERVSRTWPVFPGAHFIGHGCRTQSADERQASTIMTLHSAKGLEFGTVFLPGWEEGLFPHQRSLDESGRAGLEEERRLAYVGITRAKRRAKLFFATNRRIHGLWQSTIPSRFLDDLPNKHVDVIEAPNASQYGGYALSRFENMDTYGSTYSTPGWKRAQAAPRAEERREQTRPRAAAVSAKAGNLRSAQAARKIRRRGAGR